MRSGNGRDSPQHLYMRAFPASTTLEDYLDIAPLSGHRGCVSDSVAPERNDAEQTLGGLSVSALQQSASILRLDN